MTNLAQAILDGKTFFYLTAHFDPTSDMQPGDSLGYNPNRQRVFVTQDTFSVLKEAGIMTVGHYIEQGQPHRIRVDVARELENVAVRRINWSSLSPKFQLLLYELRQRRFSTAVGLMIGADAPLLGTEFTESAFGKALASMDWRALNGRDEHVVVQMFADAFSAWFRTEKMPQLRQPVDALELSVAAREAVAYLSLSKDAAWQLMRHDIIRELAQYPGAHGEIFTALKRRGLMPDLLTPLSAELEHQMSTLD